MFEEFRKKFKLQLLGISFRLSRNSNFFDYELSDIKTLTTVKV